jgi:hypothetical protein
VFSGFFNFLGVIGAQISNYFHFLNYYSAKNKLNLLEIDFFEKHFRKVPKTKKPLSEYTEKSFSLVSQNLHNTRQ